MSKIQVLQLYSQWEAPEQDLGASLLLVGDISQEEVALCPGARVCFEDGAQKRDGCSFMKLTFSAVSDVGTSVLLSRKKHLEVVKVEGAGLKRSTLGREQPGGISWGWSLRLIMVHIILVVEAR